MIVQVAFSGHYKKKASSLSDTMTLLFIYYKLKCSAKFWPRLTLWIDAFVENELAMSEEVEQWFKVVWTAIDEVGTT